MISARELGAAVKGKKILIDSNMIIYLTDSVQPYEPLARALFQIVEAGHAKAVFSVLSIAEVMQGPLRKGFNGHAMDVRDYLTNFPNSRCQQVTIEVLNKVGDDSRVNWQVLRTIDGLIIASGLINHVDLIVSNDKHFKKSLSPQMLLMFDSYS
jgi:predicted nucleic acid-binding protein